MDEKISSENCASKLEAQFLAKHQKIIQYYLNYDPCFQLLQAKAH